MCSTDVFLMSSFIAKSRLVHNGGYIQKLLQHYNSPESLRSGRLYLVTKVLLNLDRFYSMLATIKHFKLWKSTIIDQFDVSWMGLHERGCALQARMCTASEDVHCKRGCALQARMCSSRKTHRHYERECEVQTRHVVSTNLDMQSSKAYHQ